MVRMQVKSAVSPLFTNRDRSFWLLQLAGWVGYFLVRILNGLTTGSVYFDYPVYIAATIAGFLITVFVRYVYRVIRSRPLQTVMPSILTICVVFGLIMSSLELGVYTVFNAADGSFEGLARFSNAMFETTVLLAWSSIYFGYHYYAAFNEQRERALKAQAMAHQAQLKMLRYQLNPHFLFNTLNAISTLVLEKAGDEANEMLTKLSSFLRLTLHNQPSQRVTLDQELHALGLYLDIERVRFQDRLETVYEIDDKARKALIPSLLLQPLVENAIKYAIAPAENGGLITVTAQAQEGRLVMWLKDTGPGIADPDHIVSQSGSGVGLGNTRERLDQIYGPGHAFEIRNLEGSGLGIRISLPLEYPDPETVPLRRATGLG